MAQRGNLSGEIPTISADNNDDLQELLSWADAYADLTVRANAETTQDLETAIRFGAAGIGLARTEHMFSVKSVSWKCVA